MAERWNRLLVISRDGDAIARLVREGAADVDVRVANPDRATLADLAGRDALLTFRVPARFRGHLDAVGWIQSTGAGVDGILAAPDLPPATIVTRVVGAFGPPMSEYVLARCLAIAQAMPRFAVDRRAREWRPVTPRLLAELRVTVVGLGEIGRAIARRLAANGANVTGVSRRGAPVDGVAVVHPVERLAEVLPDTDVLVLVVPRTAESERMIGATELGRLPSGAWIVNVARGAVIAETALVAALESGRLGGAALDVFEVEPLPEESPLWTLDNVMTSPHVAGVTTPLQAASAFLENRRRLLAGETPLGLVDRAQGY